MPVFYPKKDDQEEMVSFLDAELKIHHEQKAVLSDLFRTLLHQLMTAQIRVHDLDLSFLEQEAKAGRPH